MKLQANMNKLFFSQAMRNVLDINTSLGKFNDDTGARGREGERKGEERERRAGRQGGRVLRMQK